MTLHCCLYGGKSEGVGVLFSERLLTCAFVKEYGNGKII